MNVYYYYYYYDSLMVSAFDLVSLHGGNVVARVELSIERMNRSCQVTIDRDRDQGIDGSVVHLRYAQGPRGPVGHLLLLADRATEAVGCQL